MCVNRCELPWVPDGEGNLIPDYLRGPAPSIGPDSTVDECPRREDEFASVGSPDGREVSTP